HSRPERAVAPRPAVVADERTVHDRRRPERAVAPRPAAVQRAPEPAPKARPAKAKRPAPQPEAGPPARSTVVNWRPSEPEPEPARGPSLEAKPSGPVHDENEACRSQIDPLARRWRDLGRPEGLLLHGPLLRRGLTWVASDRKLRPRPSELH